MRAVILAAGAAVLLAGGATATARAPGPSANLCTPIERVAYACTAGAKLVSLCALGDGLTYRYGKPGKPELSYPAAGAAARTAFRFSSTAYSGGGEARVRFTNGGYEYVLYTALIARGWNADGTRDGGTYDGVLVRKRGRNVANIRCTQGPDADLYGLGDMLTREAFDYDVEIGRPGD